MCDRRFVYVWVQTSKTIADIRDKNVPAVTLKAELRTVVVDVVELEPKALTVALFVELLNRGLPSVVVGPIGGSVVGPVGRSVVGLV